MFTKPSCFVIYLLKQTMSLFLFFFLNKTSRVMILFDFCFTMPTLMQRAYPPGATTMPAVTDPPCRVAGSQRTQTPPMRSDSLTQRREKLSERASVTGKTKQPWYAQSHARVSFPLQQQSGTGGRFCLCQQMALLHQS